MKALLIGYGSIGARHARILANQGHDVSCVTNNQNCPFPTFIDTTKAFENILPELIVIANRTVDHLGSLQQVLDSEFTGSILIEKPVFNVIPPSLPSGTEQVKVAYNLRFHPMVQRVADIIAGKEIYSARFHVVQHLPDWRPDTDYTTGYSAHKSQGGGVLRDLSHELDLALWLLGPWNRVTALGGHFSPLKIDSDDVFASLIETQNCPAVSIHMDYLNRVPRRGFEINAEDLSIHANFITGRLEINSDMESYQLERDTTYEKQIQAITSGDSTTQCTFEQGLAVLQLIEAIEKSARKKTWVHPA